MGDREKLDSLARLESLLEDIRVRISRLEERLQPQPTCFTYPMAAQRLGVGLTKMKEMIRRGDVKTTLVGKVPMVSLAELERVTTPTAERPKVAKAARAKAWQPIAKKR
jgi:hypothetical protein